MSKSNPVLWFCACIPLPLVPVTDPVEVTESEPVPRLSTMMPSLPETEAAAMVRFVPKFSANIPVCTPVTVPVDVEESAPVPLFWAKIPKLPPDTDPVSSVRLVPALRTKTPWLLVPVTVPVEVTDNAPRPALSA